MKCLTNTNIYNFSIFKVIFFFCLDNLNNRLNDSEQKVTNIEQIDNNDDIVEPGEHDEIILNIAGDESSEIFDSNDEEQSLFDNSDEQFVDDWTTDVIQSDYDTVHEQNMILFVLKKCCDLTSMIKRSTIITLYFDAERKKFKKIETYVMILNHVGIVHFV